MIGPSRVIVAEASPFQHPEVNRHECKQKALDGVVWARLADRDAIRCMVCGLEIRGGRVHEMR